jgi:hypothetical protein
MSWKGLEPIHLAIPGAVAGLGLMIAYLTGNLPEWLAGALVGGLIILIAAGLVIRGLVSHEATNRRALTALCLGALIAGSSGASLFTALVPREPIVDRIVERGARLELPAAAHGPLRLALQARLPGTGSANADLTLAIGHERIAARVSRRILTARSGRRGRSEVVRDESTAWKSADVPADVDSIELAKVEGSIQGGVRIRVFHDLTPVRLEFPVAIALLVLVGWMAGRGGDGRASVVTAGLILGFGLAAHELVTPDAAVRRELGALISGGLIGGSAGFIVATPFARLWRGGERHTRREREILES